jgi:catechol 2,3-dioxygenase-like lactoylglutathione lyase family enzyme
MKIKLSSVPIDDYDKAIKFYTEMMGFQLKRDMPLGGGARWITVVSPEEPDGVELLLEPNSGYPAMKALKEAHRLIFRSRISRKEAVDRLLASFPNVPEIKTLASFLEDSDKGNHGRARQP